MNGLGIETKFLNDFDISGSVFVNEPKDKMEVILDNYDFRDISERHLANLKYCFIDSKILKPNMITNDLFLLFPKIK